MRLSLKLLIAAAILAAPLFAAGAQALPLAPGVDIERNAPRLVETAHHRSWHRGGRGHHYGWYKQKPKKWKKRGRW